MLKFDGRHAKIITWLFYLVLPPGPWRNSTLIYLPSKLEFYGTHTRCAVVAMKLCETRLIAEDYKFARTHTFALLTTLCTVKHLWIWTCWTNYTVFYMSILVDFFHFKFVLDNFCSCCYYNYIASLTSYWTKLYRKLAACSLYHTGVMLEQKYNIKLICQYGYVSSCKVQTYIQRARKRCDMDCR